MPQSSVARERWKKMLNMGMPHTETTIIVQAKVTRAWTEGCRANEERRTGVNSTLSLSSEGQWGEKNIKDDP